MHGWMKWKWYQKLTQTERFFHIRNQTNKIDSMNEMREDKEKTKKAEKQHNIYNLHIFQVSERFLIHMIIYMELENAWKSYPQSKIYGVVENDDNNDSDILWVRASE